MGTVKSRNLINDEGKIERVREVNCCCGLCGVKVDDDGRVTHKWPFFCQWWDGNVRKKCIPFCLYSRTNMDADDDNDYTVITPISYSNQNKTKTKWCVFFLLNFCCDIGKKKYTASFPWWYESNNSCITALCGYTDNGCLAPLCLSGGNKDYCLCGPCLCSKEQRDGYDKNYFNNDVFRCYIPRSCCVAGFGSTKEWLICPFGCFEKASTKFCSICGWKSETSGCIFCPPTRLSTTNDGETFTEYVDQNNKIKKYNNAHLDDPIATQKITHFSGCMCGDLQHNTQYPKHNFNTQEKVMTEVNKWLNNGEPDHYQYSPPNAPWVAGQSPAPERLL